MLRLPVDAALGPEPVEKAASAVEIFRARKAAEVGGQKQRRHSGWLRRRAKGEISGLAQPQFRQNRQVVGGLG